jgi:2-methylcitrate dehydratase
MTEVDKLAAFSSQTRYEDLSENARQQVKMRILDSLGCALGALEGEPIRMIREQIQDFGGSGRCSLIGGGNNAPDRAALYNSALVRYLDYNDSYLAKGETCHPSDNLGAVLAAAEYAGRTGRDLMTAFAVAYQVQCRLSDLAPVRAKGFDHTTQGSFAVAAGVSRALGLDATKTANALAICGTAFNALRVTRTGALSNWKGLAYPNTAFACVHGTFLAMRGITGPPEVFEGNKGFKEAISGPFDIDWSREDLERITRTIIKQYNAEIHSQSALEGILELKAEQPFSGKDVQRIDLEIFEVAYNIIGGGEEGEKYTVRTKEEADHSIQYMIAAAILDGNVLPPQYLPERIVREDIQTLLRKIQVRPNEDYSRRFPNEMPCKLTVTLRDGRTLIKEKRDYEGFITHPMSWETVAQKFERLATPFTSAETRRAVIQTVMRLEEVSVSDLTSLLVKVKV